MPGLSTKKSRSAIPGNKHSRTRSERHPGTRLSRSRDNASGDQSENAGPARKHDCVHHAWGFLRRYSFVEGAVRAQGSSRIRCDSGVHAHCFEPLVRPGGRPRGSNYFDLLTAALHASAATKAAITIMAMSAIAPGHKVCEASPKVSDRLK